jgi:regulator of protease activity HflC (stomatin/prohibitin superfamily)
MSNEPKAKGEAETAINIVDALRGQQEQLKRLVAQPVWISKAPRRALSEIEAQVTELRRLLGELEKANHSAPGARVVHDSRRPRVVK